MADTTKKTDPHRAKARELLGVIDGFEIKNFNLAVTAPKPVPKAQPTAYLDAPLLTLRELMPGSTGEGDDDELDQSFRADKVEFLVMHRKLSPEETR